MELTPDRAGMVSYSMVVYSFGWAFGGYWLCRRGRIGEVLVGGAVAVADGLGDGRVELGGRVRGRRRCEPARWKDQVCAAPALRGLLGYRAAQSSRNCFAIESWPYLRLIWPFGLHV